MNNKVPWKMCTCGNLFYIGVKCNYQDRKICTGCETIDRLQKELADALIVIKDLKESMTIVASPMCDNPTFTRDIL